MHNFVEECFCKSVKTIKIAFNWPKLKKFCFIEEKHKQIPLYSKVQNFPFHLTVKVKQLSIALRLYQTINNSTYLPKN